MAKVERMTLNNETEVLYAFECPGCGISHAARVAASHEGVPLWQFNGDLNRPTFYPSIGSTWQKDDGTPVVCHAYVTDGRIRFTPDTLHALAGREVELPDLSGISAGNGG